jgi:tRNA A37 threonylcarbamoyltransferase TsaD
MHSSYRIAWAVLCVLAVAAAVGMAGCLLSGCTTARQAAHPHYGLPLSERPETVLSFDTITSN